MKRDGRRSFAFITFKHEESVPYAEAIMENVYLFNRPLRLSARSSNKDFNNNPNEPYTPEIYVNDSLLHRQAPWHSPQQQQQQPPPPPPLPVSLFSNDNNNYPAQPHYSYEDRMPPQRYERRKQHSYHPYHRNEQDYQNSKPRNGNYNQQRRGGGGGGYNNNYYR
jgi:RNA recognition motif-containing protein